MPDNNQNKPGGWKERLDALGQTPAMSPLDKAGAWNKLSERLHKKSSSRKMVMVLAVAASVLVAFMLLYPVIFNGKATSEPQRVSKKMNHENEKLVKTPMYELPGINPVPATASRKKTATQKQKMPHPYNEVKKEERLANLDDTTQQLAIEPLPVKKEDTAIIIAKTPVRKLRVVHENEISISREEALGINPRKSFMGGYNASTTGTENLNTPLNTSRIRVNPTN